MANDYFRFKQFTVEQANTAMKVCTDACLFGAWISSFVNKDAGRLLDIGAGTGLLSLMLAQKTSCKIDAVELDDGAASDAVKNFECSPWSERLHVIRGSIQSYQNVAPYDVIISNPPFFNNDLESPDKKRNLALHNTSLSLRELFCYVEQNLNSEGIFGLLVAARRDQEVLALANEMKLIVETRVGVKQTPAHAIFRYMYVLSKGPGSNVEEGEITIKDSQGNYTGHFTSLLKEYYLQL